ncbi:alpha beta-hydrolase [Infundibulicybe gibba]|nr:alpha beta-hydrolase [Infundibulicybe gibba]
MTAVPKPFKIDVSVDTLAWVTDRVKTARIIPDIQHPQGQEWADGVPTTTMEELVEYWKTSYDWRKVEEHLNATFKMFTVDVTVEGQTINLHYVHHRSSRANAIPLLMPHGWPGNFLEVEKLLSLVDPEDPAQQAYHLIAPSIPGFVFSSSPQVPGFGIARIGTVYHKLMETLGYDQYLGQGGDFGSLILRSMALQYPTSCVGIHIHFVLSTPPSPFKHPLTILWLVLRWLTPDEKKRIGRMQWWQAGEQGYSKIQGTKPQTVSYGLLDSPIGMLAWIREKLQSLTDPNLPQWSNDDVITWTMLYILSGSAAHARIYKEAQRLKDEVFNKCIGSEVDVGASCFPYDVGFIPIWWARVSIGKSIVFWKVHHKGGHFPSVECPELLGPDILEFTKAIRSRNATKWDLLVKSGQSGNLYGKAPSAANL